MTNATIEKQPKSKKTQPATDPHSYMDALLAKLGPRAELSEGELVLLFGSSIASRLPGWIENKVVSKNGGAIDPKTRRSTGWKYDLGEVIAAIRGSGEIFPETETASALVTGEVSEVIDPDKPYLASEITMLFGIPADKVDNAVSNKQLTSLTPEIREPTIRGDQLLDWVDSAKVETVLTIAAAATIARRRKFLTDNPELPERVPTIVDAAFATVGKIEAAEQAEKAERRSELLSRYRAVVCRHASPLDGDAAELATLVRELGYTRSDIDSDIVALKKVSELEPYSTDEFFRQSNSEMESAVANRKTVEQRHKEETAAAQSRESKARSNLHLALRAGSEINSIKTERRELFGT